MRTGSAIAPWGVEKAVELLSSGLDIYLVQQGAMNGSTREDVAGRAWFKPFNGVRLEFIPESDLSRPSLIRLESGAEALLSIFYKRDSHIFRRPSLKRNDGGGFISQTKS